MLISFLSGNAGAQPLFRVSPSDKLVDTSGAFFTASVSSNYDWVCSVIYTVGPATGWVVIDELSGEGDKNIFIQVSETIINDFRKADIVFTNSIGLVAKIGITQAGVIPEE
jgi:hypothetical protein